MISEASAVKIAIINNVSNADSISDEMIGSFKRLIWKSNPDAIIDVFVADTCPRLPEASHYNVIIITGGTYNLCQNEDDYADWVKRELRYIRDLQHVEETRVLAMCWGHQAVAHAFGGSVGLVPNKHMVGVKVDRLTGKGLCVFNKDCLALQHFRLRRVASPPPQAVVLAEDNSILFYPEQGFLTVSGHPEFTSSLARNILAADGGAFSGNMDSLEMAETQASFELVNDGEAVFDFMIKWGLRMHDIKLVA